MEQYFETLAKVYNTLLLISTKGEDTVAMGQCLMTLKEMLITIKEEISSKNITN